MPPEVMMKQMALLLFEGWSLPTLPRSQIWLNMGICYKGSVHFLELSGVFLKYFPSVNDPPINATSTPPNISYSERVYFNKNRGYLKNTLALYTSRAITTCPNFVYIFELLRI